MTPTKNALYFESESLSPWVFKAFLLHAFVLISFTFLAKEFPNLFKKKDLTVIYPSIRVDIVAMPKLTIRELKSMTASAADSEESVLEKKVGPSEDTPTFKKLGKRKNFLSILRDLSKKKLEAKKRNKKKLDSVELKEIIFAGNKISRGSSLTGNSEYIQFGEMIISKIKPFWKLPSYLKEQNLSNQIQVFISPSGSVLKTIINESSGVKQYDTRSLDSIKQSSPFPSPPKSIQQKLLREGIILAFPL